MNNSILVVEDDLGIRKYLTEILREQRYAVTSTASGVTALKLAEKTQPDLVLLDLKLPDLTGESVCAEIKKNSPETTVIMLTAKDSVEDKVQGLELGADDYITKPFTNEELLARIKARLRNLNGTGNKALKVDDLELDPKTMEVTRGDKTITLTPQEFRLLEYLMGNKNQVLTREMILNRVWKYSPDIESRVVDVYIGYLRKKIDSQFPKKLITSSRGFGYMIKE